MGIDLLEIILLQVICTNSDYENNKIILVDYLFKIILGHF